MPIFCYLSFYLMLYIIDDDDEDVSEAEVTKKQNNKDPSNSATVNSENDDDDDDDDILDISEDDSEKDAQSEEEEFDGSEFILFGEDLFQAVFDDDDEDTKKKPIININNTLVSSSVPQTSTNIQQQASIPNKKLTPTPVNSVKQKVNITEELNTVNGNKKDQKPSSKPPVQLNLQHTPALLELVQSTNQQNSNNKDVEQLPTNSDNKDIEELSTHSVSSEIEVSSTNENMPVKFSLTSEENDNEDKIENIELNNDEDANENENENESEGYIVVNDKDGIEKPNDENKIIEDQKPTAEEGEIEEQAEISENVKNPLPVVDDNENVIPYEDKIVVTSSTAAPTPINVAVENVSTNTKKPNKEKDEGLLDIVESIIFDEDDDENDTSSKPVKISNTDGEKDETSSGELLEISDDDDDDEDEDEDDDDEDKIEENKPTNVSEKPQSSTVPSNEIKNSKKKKKKEVGLIEVIGETLGLRRNLQRHQKTEKKILH